MQYTAYEAYSLIGVDIHWVPSVNDVSNKLFLLTIWDDNAGVPGNVIYEDDFFFPRQPKYEFDRNLFTTYYLTDTMKLAITGTFYAGWRQFDADRLNVGLDKNIDNSDKTFYSLDGENSWGTSGISGTVMIRPIFSTAMDASLEIREESSSAVVSVRVYPNPTNDIVSIDVSNAPFEGVQVFDLMGRLVIDTDVNQVDLSQNPDGLYIFRLKGVNEIVKVIKR